MTCGGLLRRWIAAYNGPVAALKTTQAEGKPRSQFYANPALFGVATNGWGSRDFALMLENPSMIRRPIVESGRALLIGFDPDEYAQKLR